MREYLEQTRELDPSHFSFLPLTAPDPERGAEANGSAVAADATTSSA
jgi:hypothetical protein